MITHNRGNEFLDHSFKKYWIKNKYRIKAKCDTTENPQAKSILERINQGIANLVQEFDFQNNYLDDDEPWSDILSATAFAIYVVHDKVISTAN